MQVILLALLWLFLSNIALADSQLTLSPGVMYFDYEERDDDGSFIDGETGPVPGVSAEFKYIFPSKIIGALYGGLYIGEVEYDGHADDLAKTPVTTDTKANYFSLGADARIPLEGLPTRMNLNVGYLFKRWERDIRPTFSPAIGAVAGLYEVYHWQELSMGFEWAPVKQEWQQWNFYAGIFQTYNPNIVINKKAEGNGEPKLYMGTDTGFKVSAQWMQSKQTKNQMGFRATYKTWRFGKSNSELISGGTELITEPKSRSRLLFIELVFPVFN